MFGINKLKGRLNSLEAENKRLADLIKKQPEIKVCSECRVVKPKIDFMVFNGALRSYGYMPPSYNEYCSSCEPIIEKRKEAVKAAELDPDAVLKCVNKKVKK